MSGTKLQKLLRLLRIQVKIVVSSLRVLSSSSLKVKLLFNVADVLTLLEKYCSDSVPEVADTCHIAVKKLQWLQNKQVFLFNSSLVSLVKQELFYIQSKDEEPLLSKNPYFSVDPAPPALERDTKVLRDLLLDENETLFSRYRAMFALRNKGDTDSVLALAEGESKKDYSPILRRGSWVKIKNSFFQA